jgi:proteic killer suppression protein
MAVTRRATLAGVIRSFRDKDTLRLWDRERVRRLGPDIQRSALRRLTRLDAAESLDDMRAFPGNRLARLRGDRAGQHSIRVNDQWRICFVWTDAGPEDVEIVDYH